MTDEELIARLRDLGDHASFEPHMHHTAADRIEDLVERNKELALQLLATQGQAAEAEAKLAKVVEALPRWIVAMCEWDHGGEQAIEEMTATLAEIKPHSGEFAMQKGESHD